MVQYIYTGGVDGDHFYQGLPATDLDDTDLTEQQKQMIIRALVAEHYRLGVDFAEEPDKTVVTTVGYDNGTTSQTDEADDNTETDEGQAQSV